MIPGNVAAQNEPAATKIVPWATPIGTSGAFESRDGQSGVGEARGAMLKRDASVEVWVTALVVEDEALIRVLVAEELEEARINPRS